MSHIESCRVCGKPGNSNYTVFRKFALIGSNTLKSSKWQYCSKECNYRETWKQDVYIAGLFSFVVIGMIAIGIIWVFGIATLSLIAVIILFYANFKRTYWLRDDPQITGPPKLKNLIVESDGETIYSEILEKEVRKCCYQSARLHDKYCVCGRALEYPDSSN